MAKFLTKDVNKLVNLGVLKHHQSAGLTIALKNLSHGLVNNVARSHVAKYLWENTTLYFATDPVAMDRIGWTILDRKRKQMGMPPLALATADSTFIRMQPEHVEIAGILGLGESDPDKIELKTVRLS